MSLIEDKINIICDIINEAGGEIIGRTRLQKIFYLLEAAGEHTGFHFDYHYYGPYSEELSQSALIACELKKIDEEEHPTSWGGFYSIYRLKEQRHITSESPRSKLVSSASSANAVTLELAATAAFFAKKGEKNPWEETQRRKPEKADGGRLNEAKSLYKKLHEIDERLPIIAS
jgi:uncharacterized protein YwgA